MSAVTSEYDPLEGIESRPTTVQLAILVSVVRNIRGAIAAQDARLRSIERGVWALVLSLIAVAATLLSGHIH